MKVINKIVSNIAEVLDKATTSTVKEVVNKESGAFSVIIDDVTRANNLLKLATKEGLLVPDIHIYPKEGESSLDFFFSDNKNDVNYVHTVLENVIKGLTPRYSASDDYYEIRILIREAGERKRLLKKKLETNKQYTLKKLVTLNEYAKAKSAILGLELLGEMRKAEEHRVKKQVMSAAEATSYVADMGSYLQIGTQIVQKNVNDRIIIEYSE